MSDSIEVGKAHVTVRPETAGFEEQLNANVGEPLKKMAELAGIAFGAEKVKDFFSEAISGAADLQRIDDRVKFVFGSASDSVESFAKGATESFGATEKQALASTAKMGNFFNTIGGLSKEKTAEMSESFTKLAGNLAYFSGDDIDTASQKLTMALEGATRGLKSYGIVLKPAEVQLKALEMGLIQPAVNADKLRQAQDAATKAQMALTAEQAKYTAAVKAHGAQSSQAVLEAEKVKLAQDALTTSQDKLTAAADGSLPKLNEQQTALATYELVLQKTADKSDYFATHSDELAAKQLTLHDRYEAVVDSLGNRLLPIATQFTQFLTEKGIPALDTAGTYVIPRVATAVGDVADVFDKVGTVVGPPLVTTLGFLGDHFWIVEGAAGALVALKVVDWAAGVGQGIAGLARSGVFESLAGKFKSIFLPNLSTADKAAMTAACEEQCAACKCTPMVGGAGAAEGTAAAGAEGAAIGKGAAAGEAGAVAEGAAAGAGLRRFAPVLSVAGPVGIAAAIMAVSGRSTSGDDGGSSYGWNVPGTSLVGAPDIPLPDIYHSAGGDYQDGQTITGAGGKQGVVKSDEYGNKWIVFGDGSPRELLAGPSGLKVQAGPGGGGSVATAAAMPAMYPIGGAPGSAAGGSGYTVTGAALPATWVTNPQAARDRLAHVNALENVPGAGTGHLSEDRASLLLNLKEADKSKQVIESIANTHQKIQGIVHDVTGQYEIQNGSYGKFLDMSATALEHDERYIKTQDELSQAHYDTAVKVDGVLKGTAATYDKIDAAHVDMNTQSALQEDHTKLQLSHLRDINDSMAVTLPLGDQAAQNADTLHRHLLNVNDDTKGIVTDTDATRRHLMDANDAVSGLPGGFKTAADSPGLAALQGVSDRIAAALRGAAADAQAIAKAGEGAGAAVAAAARQVINITNNVTVTDVTATEAQVLMAIDSAMRKVHGLLAQ